MARWAEVGGRERPLTPDAPPARARSVASGRRAGRAGGAPRWRQLRGIARGVGAAALSVAAENRGHTRATACRHRRGLSGPMSGQLSGWPSGGLRRHSCLLQALMATALALGGEFSRGQRLKWRGSPAPSVPKLATRQRVACPARMSVRRERFCGTASAVEPCPRARAKGVGSQWGWLSK